jgi:alpha-1,6-mannosyltransferase
VVGKRDGRALAEGIEAVFADDPVALGERARAWVERHYTWDSVLRGLVTLYAGLHGAQTSEVARAYAAR